MTKSDDIYREVTTILEEITEECDGAPITADAKLDSFGIESVNLVYVIAEIQQKYDLKDLLFKKLIADNRDILSLDVSELVGYIHELKD